MILPTPEPPAAAGAADAEPAKFKLKPKTAYVPPPAGAGAPPPAAVGAPPSPAPRPPAGAPSAPGAPAPKVPPPFPVMAPPKAGKPTGPLVPHVTVKEEVAEVEKPASAAFGKKALPKSVLILASAAAVLLLGGGGYFAYTQYFAAPPPAPPPAQKATPPATAQKPGAPAAAGQTAAPAQNSENMSAALKQTVTGSIQKAKDVIAGREKGDQGAQAVNAIVEAGGVPTPPPPASTAVTPPDARLSAVTTTTALAPGLAATSTSEMQSGLQASAAFRAFVANAQVRGATAERAIINGRVVSTGQAADVALGVIFESYNSETRTLTFRDRAGATVTRRL